MKFENISHVPSEEIQKALAAEVEEAGAQNEAAKKIGVERSELNQVLHGHMKPTRRILDFLGLEVRKVYVRKGS